MGELGFLLRLRTRRGRLSGGGETLCLGGSRGERLLALSERLLPLPLSPGELHGAFSQALLDDLLLAQQLLVRLTRGALVRANLVDFIAAAGGHVGVTPQLVLELAQLALVCSPRLELLRTQHARGGDGVISLAGQLGELVAVLLLQLVRGRHTRCLLPLRLSRYLFGRRLGSVGVGERLARLLEFRTHELLVVRCLLELLLEGVNGRLHPLLEGDALDLERPVLRAKARDLLSEGPLMRPLL